MFGRSILVAVWLAGSAVGPAEGALDASLRVASASSLDVNLAAYRTYALAQADGLVGMTKVLAREIRDGDLDAAQSAYAPAHRYLKSLEPIARLWGTLHQRMDARVDVHESDDAGMLRSGFHRLEHGLFANRSVVDLSDAANRLAGDARELRERIRQLDIEPSALLDTSARLTQELADRGLAGDGEPYSKTDLWDLEANIDGVRQVVALMQPQLQARGADRLARAAERFVKTETLLTQHKAGCGFKRYDELAAADKAALKAQVAALAEAISTLHASLAVD